MTRWRQSGLLILILASFRNLSLLGSSFVFSLKRSFTRCFDAMGFVSRRRLGVCWKLGISRVYSSEWNSGSRRVPIIVILVRIFARWIDLSREGVSATKLKNLWISNLGCTRNLLPRGSARVIDGQRWRRPFVVKGARLAAVSRARVHSVGGRHVSHADVRMHLYAVFGALFFNVVWLVCTLVSICAHIVDCAFADTTCIRVCIYGDVCVCVCVCVWCVCVCVCVCVYVCDKMCQSCIFCFF